MTSRSKPTPRKPRQNAEARMSARFAELLRLSGWPVVATKVYNEVSGLRENAKAKWMGALPGFPDWIVCVPNGWTLLIEFKSVNGKLSKRQQAVHAGLEAIGHPPMVFTSASDAILQISMWCSVTRPQHPIIAKILEGEDHG